MKKVMEELQRSARYQKRKAAEAPHQFKELEASSLFCQKCKEAVPVRKKLLLALPQGDKYDYLCTQCGSPVGSKTTKDDSPMQFGIK